MKLTLLPDGDSPDGQDDQGRGGGRDSRQVVERGGGVKRRRRRMVYFDEEDDKEEAPAVDHEANNQAVVLSCPRGGPAGVSTAKTHGDLEIQGGHNRRKHGTESWSTVRKLHFREIGFNCSGRPCGSSSFVPRPPSFSQEVFSTIKNKQVVFDIYKFKNAIQRFERLIRKRSAVLQILPLKDIVAVVLCSGLSFVLSRATNKMMSILNRYDDEMILAIFYNNEDNSVITTSTRLSDGGMSREVTSTPLQYIGSNSQNSGRQIFQSENIAWPDDVEFDASNARALITQHSTYRVFDLKDYSLLYEIPAVNVQQIVFRPSLLLVKWKQTRNTYPFRIFCAQSFEELHSFMLVANSKRPVILSALHDKLIIKEKNSANEDGNMHILDLHSLKTCEVPMGKFEFQLLHGRNLFLSFRENSTELRDLQGNVVRNFENHVLSSLNSTNETMCITKEEDVIISECRSEGSRKVHISSIESGKSIATIDTKVVITALSYNSDTNEIYIGTSKGKIQVWSA